MYFKNFPCIHVSCILTIVIVDVVVDDDDENDDVILSQWKGTRTKLA